MVTELVELSTVTLTAVQHFGPHPCGLEPRGMLSAGEHLAIITVGVGQEFSARETARMVLDGQQGHG